MSEHRLHIGTPEAREQFLAHCRGSAERYDPSEDMSTASFWEGHAEAYEHLTHIVEHNLVANNEELETQVRHLLVTEQASLAHDILYHAFDAVSYKAGRIDVFQAVLDFLYDEPQGGTCCP